MSILFDNQEYGHLNRQYLYDIKNNIKTVVPFIGAGMSMPYGYPSWSELITKVLNSICHVSDLSSEIRDNIYRYIENGQYMDATGEMQKYWPNLEDFVFSEMTKIRATGGSCLDKYVHLFPSNVILTTNYDTIVEELLWRYNYVKTLFPTSPTSTNTVFKIDEKNEREKTLCYLHGKYTEQSTIVFSRTDYDDFYGRPEDVMNIKSISRRPIVKHLQEFYFRYPILFLGCSMNVEEDRVLSLLRRFNKIGQQPQNFSYALLDSANLTPDQMNHKINDLVSIRVCPIWYSSENDISAHEKAKNELLEYILKERVIEFEVWKEENEIKKKENEAKEKKAEATNKELDKIISTSSEVKSFEYQQKYFKSNDNYKFILIMNKSSKKYFISDQGKTYEMLDRIFQLKEPDVQKNLIKISNECGVLNIRDVLVVPVKSDNINEAKKHPSPDDIKQALCNLFACVSFMDKMRIFYV